MASVNKSSTILLRAVTILVGAGVLALCILVLPNGIRVTHWDGYRPILLGMYLPAIPFFLALFQALRLLNLIDHNKTFSKASVQALNTIKLCGVAIGAMYGVGLPYIYITAQKDDAPGVIAIGLVFTFAPIAIAVLAAILQKVFQDAIKIKSINDKTI